MLETIDTFLSDASSFLWGYVLLFCLLGTHLYLTIILRFPQLYFFRDAKGTAEVDFVLVQDGTIYPMEVKRSSSPAAADLRHAAKIPTGPFTLHPGIVFCTAEQMYALDKGAVAFPISML